MIGNTPWWEVALGSPPFCICVVVLALGASFLLGLRLGRALVVVFAKMDGLEVLGMEWDAGGGMAIGSSVMQLVVKEPSGLPFPGKGGDGKTMVQYLNM